MEGAASGEEEVGGVSTDRTLLNCVKFNNTVTSFRAIFSKSPETHRRNNGHKMSILLFSLTPIQKLSVQVNISQVTRESLYRYAEK